MGKPLPVSESVEFDVQELQSNLVKSAWLWQEFSLKAAAAALGQLEQAAPDPAFKQTLNHWGLNLLFQPATVFAASTTLMQKQTQMWQRAITKLWGWSDKDISESAKRDRRFKDSAWQTWAGEVLSQSYVNQAEFWKTLAQIKQGLTPREARQAEFFIQNLVDALSPSNYALTNPQVWQAIRDTNGANLVKAMQNLLQDYQDGELRIRMTDPNAFEVGKNIATTQGKVIFRNELIELIQYHPSTPEVRKNPLLIVPPWINKFYILDLREQNSFVKWAVDQGHTVFMISWVNPGAEHSSVGFDDYLQKGTLAAMDAIEKATGEHDINVASYCLGGTMTGMTLAYQAAKKDDRVKSATFFTTLLDFSEPGELGVFLDEAQIEALEKRMQDNGGYLDGKNMAAAFNMLRSNDLIWSFFINLYLLGKDPAPFDLLYWNSDSTRMPAKMHGYYLRNMYLHNRLREAGGITLNGTALDLRQIKTPAYFVSAYDDHIAPWRSTYKGAQLFSGPVKFVLGQSGHIAGIVNPAAQNKYGHWINDRLEADADTWFNNAKEVKQSWWHDWDQWVSVYAGGKVAARQAGAGELPALEDAPGTYVRRKV